MDLITEVELARMLGLTRGTVQRFRRKGLIPYIPGVPALFDRRDVDAFIAKRKEEKVAKRAERRRGPTPEEREAAWEAKLRFKMTLKAEKAKKLRSETAG